MTEADRSALRARLAAALPPAWRTRFAPAPTGHLHLGHAVNAVYVWSIAQAFGGSVIVRIEDHDYQRSRREFATSILDDLAWLGLASGNLALGLPSPVRQSDQQQRYESALDHLSGVAAVYTCRCSRRDVAAQSNEPGERRYPGTCRAASVAKSETRARRLYLPGVTVAFDDLRHGTQEQRPCLQCGDLLLRDRLGQWTYQFAVVVDDMADGIDAIIRGDDLLESTGRQLLLANMLGRERPPTLLHHPLLTHADGSKLSKSNHDTGLSALREDGWSPARVLGHAAWLGGLQTLATPRHAYELGALWSQR